MSSPQRLKVVPKDDLSPDEISKAASLAEELRRQDAERQAVAAAAEEVGIAREYLEQAAARIQAETRQREEAIAHRRKAAAIAACVLVTIAAVNVAVWRTNQAARQAEEASLLSVARTVSPRTAAATGTAAIPQKSLVPTAAPVPLSIIPVPGDAPILVRAHTISARLPATSMTFRNNYGQPVTVYEMNANGSAKPQFTLGQGETRQQTATFGQPWLVTNEQGKNLGLFFPQTAPSLAAIHSPNVLRSLQSVSRSQSARNFQGYLSPIDINLRAARTTKKAGGNGAASPANRLDSAIEFVNLTGDSVELYRVDAEGVRTPLKTLEPGVNFVSPTYAADAWLVVDPQHDVIATFKADPVPRTAILWPE